MDPRLKMIKKAYDRYFFLKVRNPEYAKSVESFFKHFVREDLGRGDITTDTLLNKRKAKARIIAKEDGVLAGGEEFRWLCRNNRLFVRSFRKDGERFRANEKLFQVSGPRRYILYLERTGLNLLQRMSGIATETSEIVSKVNKKEFAVTATRKTHWGYLDKKAVTIGGGFSHRLGLHESFLIKDNHLASLKKQGVRNPIGESLEKAWKSRKGSVFIEIEVKTPNHALHAAKKFNQLKEETDVIKTCVIMLDNMEPPDIRKTIALLKENDLYDHVLLEASGSVTKKNIMDYVRTGVDACSLGSLTHSSRAIDISLSLF